MKKVLTITKLSREVFRPYGQFIDHHEIEPVMDEEQFVFWNNLAQTTIKGNIDFGILEVVKREKTFSKIERHTNTVEIFFALDNDCLMLAGQSTPGEKYANPETVKAFYLSKGQGVIFNKGTWHWLPFPLSDKAYLIVISRQGTVDDDLEIVDMKDLGFTFEIEL